MRKLTRLTAAASAFALAASAFAGVGVSAAAQSLPFSEDFSGGSISADKGWSYTGALSVSDKKVVNNDSDINTVEALTLDFDTVNSGVLVIEADLHMDNTGTVELVRVNDADGNMLLSVWPDGRGASGTWINTKKEIKLNNDNWGASIKDFPIKLEIDFSEGKWQFWQNREKAPLYNTSNQSSYLPFASGSVNAAAQLVFATRIEKSTYDNIKVYKKLEAKQTAAEMVMLVGKTKSAPLTVTPLGEKVSDMKWESSDADVCSVDNSGNITAKKVGTAKVTAKSEFYGYNFTYEIDVKQEATAIAFEKGSATMAVGQSQTFGYSLTPADSYAGSLSWTSSEESVATVDSDGKVTALSAGETVITVSGENGIFADMNVTVIIPPESVSLSGASATMNPGEKATLTASFSPATATVDASSLVWRTSNHYVATVSDSGVVTAVGKGTAEIYVSYADLVAKTTVSVTGDDIEKKSPLVAYIEKGASFADIADMQWAQDAVQSVAANGYMTPDSDTSFGAKRNIKRDELVSMVIKTLKLENKKAKNPVERTFEDVGEDNVYRKEIAKAVELGIIEGISETEFAPNADITRQDMAVVICKALEAASVKTVEGRLDFADKDDIAEYAQKSVRVLSKMGVISGKSDNMFDPLANTTRAEAAVLSNKLTALR